MFCWNCGKEVGEGDAFCPACGAKLKTEPAPPEAAPQAAPEPPRTVPASGGGFAPARNNTNGANSEKKTLSDGKMGLIYLLVGIGLAALGVMNARDMASEEPFLVILGFLPVQYPLYIAGGIGAAVGVSALWGDGSFSWKTVVLAACAVAAAFLIGGWVSGRAEPANNDDLVGSVTQNADGSYTWSPPEYQYVWPTNLPFIR